MIAWLKGLIVDKQHPGKIVLNVQGVGYDVETSLNTFFQLETHAGEVGLHIHTIVREDAFLLFGFLDKNERALFRSLIKVNGIGPKSAMAILSSISPQEFIHCINQQNSALLTKLPGIGKKTAERLLVEMKDAIKPFLSAVTEGAPSKTSLPQQEAMSALEALGFKQQEALSVVKRIDDGSKSCEQLIRQALQSLSRP